MHNRHVQSDFINKVDEEKILLNKLIFSYILIKLQQFVLNIIDSVYSQVLKLFI